MEVASTGLMMGLLCVRSRESSVIQRWAKGWMIGGSSPGRGWEFFSTPSRPDWFWGPSSLLSNVYRGALSLGVKQ
jgi:hypothetical protein